MSGQGHRVGDVVVCVDAQQIRGRPPTLLVKGQFYRIDDVAESADQIGCQVVSVEGVDVVYHNGKTYWLRADRFRKLPSADDDFIAQVRAYRPHDANTPVFA